MFYFKINAKKKAKQWGKPAPAAPFICKIISILNISIHAIRRMLQQKCVIEHDECRAEKRGGIPQEEDKEPECQRAKGKVVPDGEAELDIAAEPQSHRERGPNRARELDRAREVTQRSVKAKEPENQSATEPLSLIEEKL